MNFLVIDADNQKEKNLQQKKKFESFPVAFSMLAEDICPVDRLRNGV